ncbi:hypothetical protein B0J12DRAFT_562088 [Macrophomina phaseolina]|uniref:DUF7703 domain-containing protein n=1 Tax=Macrophomina phaseolina TaxID=35725 RepID=A0ABQ8GSV9_9PEZI|nr:hypothetical protein B0J12DRAFT_562088 [Macrophomina phaseolina]
MAGFLAIAFYNVVELFVIIFATFKQRSGLYFWSFIVATVGIFPHTLGFVLKFFGVLSESLWWLSTGMVAIGFPAMVTGQSIVLYSRLHLVVRDLRKLRWILFIIIFNGVVFSTPLIILAFGANSPNPAPFLGVFTVWDKIQIAVFAVQEIFLSVIYIWETTKLLGPTPMSNQALRKILHHLIAVNAIVLAFDITLLGVQYSNLYEIQTCYKSAVYSIKLKLEFSVLNNLINVIKNGSLSSGARAYSSSGAHSRRMETFSFGKRSKGSKDDGVFSQIEEFPPPKSKKPSSHDVFESDEFIRAEDRETDHAGRRHFSQDHDPDQIAHVVHPKKSRSISTEASELELVRLPEPTHTLSRGG